VLEFLIALAFISGPLKGILSFLGFPFLDPVVVAFLGIGFLMVWHWVYDQPSLMPKPTVLYLCLLLAIYAVALVSAMYTVSEGFFVEKTALFFIPLGFAVLITLSGVIDYARLLRSIVLLSALIAVPFMWYFPLWRLGLLDPNAFDLDVMRTLYLGVGGVCAVSLLITTFAEIHLRPLLRTALILFFLPALFVSSARAALIFALLMLTVGFYIRLLAVVRAMSASRLAVFAPILVSVALLGLLFLSASLNEQTIEVLNASLDRLLLLFSDEKGASVNARLSYVEGAMVGINQQPLRGYGVASFGPIVLGADIFMHPHNILMEFWFELGLFGLIWVLVFMGASLYFGIQSGNLILLLILIFSWANAMKSFSYAENRQLFIAATLAFRFWLDFRWASIMTRRANSVGKRAQPAIVSAGFGVRV
jgi:O-antigen ligase